MNKILVIGLAIVSLLGCEKQIVEPIQEANKQVVSGSIVENGVEMPINDYHAVWAEKDNMLVVYLTAAKISDEAKYKIDSSETGRSIFSEESSPDESRWTRYPFAVAKLSFDSNRVRKSELDEVSLLLYDIDQSNSTTTLSTWADPENYDRVEFSDGVLSLKFSGDDTIFESTYSWSIDINGGMD